MSRSWKGHSLKCNNERQNTYDKKRQEQVIGFHDKNAARPWSGQTARFPRYGLAETAFTATES